MCQLCAEAYRRGQVLFVKTTGEMPQSEALKSVQLLHQRSRDLQTRSNWLQNESRELCLVSHKLRKANAFVTYRRNALNPTRALAIVEEEKSAPNVEGAEGAIHCELIRIRTPGFHRHAARKIIKP